MKRSGQPFMATPCILPRIKAMVTCLIFPTPVQIPERCGTDRLVEPYAREQAGVVHLHVDHTAGEFHPLLTIYPDQLDRVTGRDRHLGEDLDPTPAQVERVGL